MSQQGPSPFLPEDVPADPQDARRANRNRVLRTIITRGAATRAELSRRTGLSRPTVSVIANDLMTAGLLCEGERVASGGAPGTLLEIAKDTGVTIVADLRNQDHVRMATVSVSGEVVTATAMPTPTTQDVAEAIVDFTRRVEPAAVLGIALAVPGWVDPAGEWLTRETHGGDPSLADRLRRAVRMPVFAVNATDAIALADLRDSPPDLAAQATVVLADRIGMGLIVSGRLRTGIKRPAGDISHIATGTPGPTCEVCSGQCLQAQVLPLLTDTSHAQQGAATALAAVLCPIAGAVELEELVLAGFPEEVAADLAASIHAEMLRRMPEYQVPAVRVSQRGDDAVLVGACMMMLYRRLG